MKVFYTYPGVGRPKAYGIKEVYSTELLEHVAHNSQAGNEVTHYAQMPFFSAI